MDAVGWKHPLRKRTEASVWEPSVEKRGMMVSGALSRMPVQHHAHRKAQKENF